MKSCFKIIISGPHSVKGPLFRLFPTKISVTWQSAMKAQLQYPTNLLHLRHNRTKQLNLAFQQQDRPLQHIGLERKWTIIRLFLLLRKLEKDLKSPIQVIAACRRVEPAFWSVQFMLMNPTRVQRIGREIQRNGTSTGMLGQQNSLWSITLHYFDIGCQGPDIRVFEL